MNAHFKLLIQEAHYIRWENQVNIIIIFLLILILIYILAQVIYAHVQNIII